MNRDNLSNYKKYGYKFNHIAVRFDCQGLCEFDVGYKSTLDRHLRNGDLSADVEILTFRQAALEYPEHFTL